MHDSPIYFSEAHVKSVADKMNVISKQYEQLFSNLGSQIYTDIVELKDMSEVMTVCINHIERALLAFQSHFPDPSVIACAKGCHHCCSFPIVCPPQVVIDIALYLRATYAPDDQDSLRQKMAHYIDQPSTPLKRSQCPFLDETKSCSIYEKRPLACRWFTSPDAKICEQSVVDGRNVSQHPIRHRIFQAATTALLASAKEQGVSYEQVPFILSLWEALDGEYSESV